MDMAGDPNQEYIYFIGSETLPSICYILSGPERDKGKVLIINHYKSLFNILFCSKLRKENRKKSK